MQRRLMKTLEYWRDKPARKPLLLRGARQVGKSTLIEAFAAQHFKSAVTLNLEFESKLIACFDSLDPKKILDAVRVTANKMITPGETLLFIDEIQESPNAIRAMRYFKEKMPELHVIGAGSLLELTLSQAEFRLPVGRVDLMYMYPMSFEEYLATINPQAYEVLQATGWHDTVSEPVHEYLLEQVKLYMMIGGMPESIAHYTEHQDFLAVQHLQEAILNTYRNDFTKYDTKANPVYLRECFNKLPYKVGEQIKYSKINPDVRSAELKEALETLELAMIAKRIQSTSAQGLPLQATVNDKKFKMNFVDVGLVKNISGLDSVLLLERDLTLLNRGALAEQFVGQELLAYSDPAMTKHLHYWSRDGSATAEIDYLEVIQGEIVPIEVKAGKVGTLRSLKRFMEERDSRLGVRISGKTLQQEGNILSIPLYMIGQLPRLVTEYLAS